MVSTKSAILKREEGIGPPPKPIDATRSDLSQPDKGSTGRLENPPDRMMLLRVPTILAKALCRLKKFI
jgi:hypothetical protein